MLKSVFLTIGENHVIRGFYSIRGNVLRMEGAGPDGKPIAWEDGTPITADIPPGGDPDAIARMLTKKIRKMLLGERVPGFTRVIDHSDYQSEQFI